MNLQANDTVIKMLHLMEEIGQVDQAQEMKLLIACIDSMEQQYNAVFQELHDIKRQLSERPENQGQDRINLTDISQTLENDVGEMQKQLKTVQERVISCAKNALSSFKKIGISALDTAVCALGIKTLLESMQNKICNAMEKTDISIQKVENIGHELRSVGGHLKNAGRTVIGKEAQAVDGGQGGRFQSVVLAPMKALNSMYSGMNRTIYGALGAVERLEHTAEKNRGKREKPSVRQRLEEKKAESLAHASSAPTRKSYEVSL